MPFKSYEQEWYLRLNHPDIWKRWAEKYGSYTGSKQSRRKKNKRKTSKRKKK